MTLNADLLKFQIHRQSGAKQMLLAAVAKNTSCSWPESEDRSVRGSEDQPNNYLRAADRYSTLDSASMFLTRHIASTTTGLLHKQ